LKNNQTLHFMKRKNKAILIWALMFAGAFSSNAFNEAAFEGARNIDILKLILLGFLGGGLFNEIIHHYIKKPKE